MRILPLLLIACAAAAEDQPVPPPPPAADPTAPAPAAPPLPSAEPTPAAPVQGGAPAPVPAANGGRRGNLTAGAAGAGAAAEREKPKPFSLAAELDLGYDSNVLRQDTSNPQASDKDSAMIGADLRGTWRALRESGGALNLVGDLKYDGYPSQHLADYVRVGAAAVGQLRYRFVDPGMVLGVNRLFLDGAGVATVGRFSLTATHFDDERRGADTLVADLQPVHYDQDHDASGALYDLSYRHWWLLQPGVARRRIEASLTGGAFSANASFESYRTITPGLAIKERFDDTALGGPLDAALDTRVEFRRYDDGLAGSSAERQVIWSLGLTADRWLNEWLAVGAYGTFTLRDSNLDGRDYRRFQAGARLLAAW